MAEQQVDNNAEYDRWLRDRIRAASVVAPSSDFRQRVLREASERQTSAEHRMRRVATILQWSGIAVFVVGVLLVIALFPAYSIAEMPLRVTSTTATVFGIVLAVVLGLATWEWLDRYV